MEKGLKVLIIGNGGEAYSLARRLSVEGVVIYYLSGNYGLYMLGCNPLKPEKFTTVEKIQKFVSQEEIDLTIVLSNFWTANRLVKVLRENGHAVIGANTAVTEVLQDRVLTRETLCEIGINQPSFSARSFESFYKFNGPWPVVIKNRFNKKNLGEFSYIWANQETVHHKDIEKLLPKEHLVFIIEDYVPVGQEISVVVLCSQNSYIIMSAAYMYKQHFEGLQNVNSPVITYTPTGFLKSKIVTSIKQTVIKPFLGHMNYKEKPCCGFLSFKIMLVDNEPYLLDIHQGLDGLEALLISSLLNSTLHELMIKTGEELVIKRDQESVVETDNKFVEVVPSYSADEVIACNKFLLPNSSKNIVFKNLKEEEDTQLIFGNVEYVQNKIIAAGPGPILSIISRGDNPVTLIHEFANKALSQHFNNEYTDIGFINEVTAKLKENISIKDGSLHQEEITINA